ncbi:DUF4351 domain-containing protein [Rhodoferax antarcticus]|uniref:DUF4351 domain-containing protein n=1 Tax=Rhodoferax antarcticus TaxID=81479 RepID=UPI002225620A|nr:DUF4351 domain-containing protein [Rhodoferax antarcticus]MCW2312806.1 hypothetical protein [Rhodoferax antarcticus]
MTTDIAAIPDNYDTPWKEAIEHHFPEFMAFYFPKAHCQIDWQKGYIFLDQELQAVVQDAELGKRFVDKLVQVNRLSGQEDWIYIHLEVQGSAQAEFAERMFVYNYRIYDRYHRPVASMAVLADDTPSWKPQEFGYDVLDCQMGIRFPIAKLLDYADRAESLENDPNPFALVTLAHLQTRATRTDPQARFAAKWRLIQLLFRRGWARQSILDLLYVLDWMMKLPDYLSVQLWQNVANLAQEKKMAYVSSFERIAIEKGMQAGMQQGMQQGMRQGMQQGEALALQKLLTKRFGVIPSDTVGKITTASSKQLDAWLDLVLDAPSLSAVFDGPPPSTH